MILSSLLAATFAISGALATPTPFSSTQAKRASCDNSATDRSCWGDYSTSTDYYNEVPDTGVTVEYYFDLQNGTASLDGVERQVLTVNGTFPGPTIIANWGDTVGK
jgi:FtsP/CotA-like multicopper oxidase with cupredoxin domain